MPFLVGSSLHAAACGACQLLVPDIICTSVKPSPADPKLDSEDFPILAPLTEVVHAHDGETLFFCLEAPPCNFVTFPWRTFSTLKAARLQAEWVKESLDVCQQALLASARAPVVLGFDRSATQALPLVASWFVQGGFVRRDESFVSPFVSPRVRMLEACRADS